MKNFIFIAFLVLTCTSCSQPQTLKNIPEMEYEEYEPNVETEINYIFFELDNIVDFNYEVETNTYSIAYNDEDCFDYDNLAYLSNKEDWYGKFLIVHLTKTDFYELLEDINSTQEERWNIVYQEKWQLKEMITSVEGGTNFQYYLLKNPMYE